MTLNPQSALDRLIGALEEFHSLALSASDPETPAVLEAADVLAEAYTIYDDVMFTQYGVECPLDVYPDEDFDDEDDEELDFDDDEYDFDDEDDEDDEESYEDDDLDEEDED